MLNRAKRIFVSAILAVLLSLEFSSISYSATGVAIEFDGTNDSVDFGNQATLQDSNGDWVVAGWIYIDSLAASVWLFGDRQDGTTAEDGIRAHINTSGEIVFAIQEGDSSGGTQSRSVTTTSTTPYTTGVWQKWALRYDPSLTNGICALDGDGNFDCASDAFVDNSGERNDGLHVGASRTDQNDMDGKIAYVHVWCCSKTSSAATVASALDDPGSDTTDLLSAYWFCSGAETTDSSGNGYTATLGGDAVHSSAGPTVTNDPCGAASPERRILSVT